MPNYIVHGTLTDERSVTLDSANHNTVVITGKSLQEAALETLKESLKNQPKLVPTRPLESQQKPKEKPINYTRGLSCQRLRIVVVVAQAHEPRIRIKLIDCAALVL